ncbi:MAG: DUF1292 domain-containing protein [Lachnospiraceae bacterium]|nr:DUF1292 domain-containing protein [Lachnospiraceae bacterium]
MEKILFQAMDEEPVEFYVLEQTTVAGVNYILVTDTEDGDGEALILKDISGAEDEEAVYDIVSEDKELNAIAEIFENLLDDVEFDKSRKQ